ncbi:uncharacterized protein MELLADRAFT_92099 [Melampsora larici-populina 98AG31]|uniref:Alpha-type protein kinase domain-containing protein n=1 Tax=Melampsora larici-populina (strain 98AG31 / pathotype 3-4-7) TaxID=747676 RepID=F4S1H6_MELLP|nr:uncharacterized protein MELLADRAFT_92099 [Melampsora larici-populina 98AG31]EGG01376.1 hypothetical protein MELLADRAFT_92099 [Melampsora larici-populina 98AG31]
MNSPICSACRQRPATFRDFCSPCLKIRLAPGSASPPDPPNSSEIPSPMTNQFNYQHHPQLLATTTSTSAYQAPQPTNNVTQPASNFDVRAYKHAAASVAAHNNSLQPPHSTMSSTLAISPPFDPLALAKEIRNRTIAGGAASKVKRPRGGVATTTRQRARPNPDTPTFDSTNPIITFVCGFEIYQAPKWAKAKPLPVSRTINLLDPNAYNTLRQDLWSHFHRVFIPNNILTTLDPAGFSFTSLGSTEATVTAENLMWWFTNKSSIDLIYDHTRYEHSQALTKAAELESPEAQILPNSAATKTHLGYGARWTQPLLHINDDKVEQGIERFGASREPYLLHSKRGISWQAGLQWLLQVDGNTVESDFVAFRWHNSGAPQTGRTHTVQSIDIWQPSGPIVLISKIPLKNRFLLPLVAPITTSRLYAAVAILLREFVVYGQNIPGLSDHVDFWQVLSKLRLVEHVIISSQMPEEDNNVNPDHNHNTGINTETGVEGPTKVMHAEEKLDLPLKSYGSLDFFGFPQIAKPSEMDYLMDAFIHWTYQHSEGHRFVTGLRGSGSVVTNPRILDMNPTHSLWIQACMGPTKRPTFGYCIDDCPT